MLCATTLECLWEGHCEDSCVTGNGLVRRPAGCVPSTKRLIVTAVYVAWGHSLSSLLQVRHVGLLSAVLYRSYMLHR